MKKTNIKYALLFIFSLVAIILPSISFAALVNCGNSVVGTDGVTTIPNSCGFDDAVFMINGTINWIIGLAGVIFTISIVYGGFLYMTSGINPGNKAKAKSLLWNTLLGFVIMLTAWLIVYTLLTYLVPSDSTIFRFIRGGDDTNATIRTDGLES
jgi:uncharacterized membrane protein